MDIKRTRQIKNHSSRDEIPEKNCNTHCMTIKKNQDIIKELNTHSFIEKINKYKKNGYNMSAEWTDLDSCAP